MQLGETIKAIREYRGMTQWELCVATRVSQTALSRIENGRSQPMEHTLEAFSKVFNVPVMFMYIHAMQYEAVPGGCTEKYEMVTPVLKTLLSQLFEDMENKLLTARQAAVGQMM